MQSRRLALCLVVAGLCPGLQAAAAQAGIDPVVPPLGPIVAAPASELRDVVERYRVDRGALGRRYGVDYSPVRRERFRAFTQGWRARLAEIDFDRLGVEGRIDHVLLDALLRHELTLLDREAALFAEMRPLLPFAERLMALEEGRRRVDSVDARAVAALFAGLPGEIARARAGAESSLVGPRAGGRVSRIVALRAANEIADLKRTLERWYRHYAGYDPLFTWWVAEPYKGADKALGDYEKFLRERIVGYKAGEDEPIVGDPIGAEGMRADLAHAFIPYTPEELIAIAERELAWCEAEMRRAAGEMGLGDDWRAALERVKTLHVAPGQQPAVVRDLAREAVAFVRERDLVTIPPLAEEVWRLEMMSPEAQKVSPFFLGGEVIRVAFPTDAMAYDDRQMSMRGNNVHFSRATVHHELIPGHHLQGFMSDRYNAHREAFATPFWHEGGALYWEMLLWDLGFPRSPEDRVGMLFWRSHRAARIIFSLSFHLGKMTPQEAVDFLVTRVGHERANAEAEVRRSFNGSYSPLYQAAYMLGGLQIRALREELVRGGRMTDKQFHDAILHGGPMPIELMRARLTGTMLPRDYAARWRFAGDPLRR
jgi:uncharacterized protein (DUF885 family)